MTRPVFVFLVDFTIPELSTDLIKNLAFSTEELFCYSFSFICEGRKHLLVGTIRSILN